MRKYLFYNNNILEWTCRIILSINLILPGINYDNLNYPLDVLIMTLIGFWFYIYKLKIFALIVLLSALFIRGNAFSGKAAD